MSEFSLLTILINAASVIKNRNGDPSIHGYVESQMMTVRKKYAHPEEAYFTSLDCLSDILVQDTQVIATSYDHASEFTLVTPSEVDNDNDDDSIQVGLAPELTSQAFVNSTCKLLHAAVVPNPDFKYNNSNCNPESTHLGQIREVKDRKNLWIEDEPLNNLLE